MAENMERGEWLRVLDRTAMWVLINAILIVIAWFVGLIHHSTEFYVLLGAAAFIAIGRQRYVSALSLWVRIRTFISELFMAFLVLGLLWRAGSWIVHLFIQK